MEINLLDHKTFFVNFELFCRTTKYPWFFNLLIWYEETKAIILNPWIMGFQLFVVTIDVRIDPIQID